MDSSVNEGGSTIDAIWTACKNNNAFLYADEI